MANDAPLDEYEQIRAEFDMDTRFAALKEAVSKGMPVTNMRSLLGEDVWWREIMRDLNQTGHARSLALKMLGEALGLIGQKAKSSRPKAIEIEEY